MLLKICVEFSLELEDLSLWNLNIQRYIWNQLNNFGKTLNQENGLISLQMRRMKWREHQVLAIFSPFHLQYRSPIGYQAFMMSYYFILNKNGNGIITDVFFTVVLLLNIWLI